MMLHSRKVALSYGSRTFHKSEALFSRIPLVSISFAKYDQRSHISTTDSRYLKGSNYMSTSSGTDKHIRCLSTLGSDKPSDDEKNKVKEENLKVDRIVYYKPIDENQSEGQQEVNKPQQKSQTGMLISLGLGASFLAGKMKFVLVALKLTKATPLISMVLTSATYSLFFGWPYAIGMVGLIFVHECGHAVVMKYYNVPFSPMVFIPFMGAVISMKERPKNSYEEALIAFGGPVLGSAAALAVATQGYATDSQLLYALADWGLMINLFNLLPIGSMDGGRICSAVSPSIGVLGLIGGGYMIYTGTISNPIFYLVMMAGTYQTTSRLMGWEEAPEDYYRISYQAQGGLFSAYLALIASLLLAMQENNRRRKTPKQLKQEAQNPSDFFPEPWAGNKDGVYDDFFPVETSDIAITKFM